jgi:nicotinamidase-related amidase
MRRRTFLGALPATLAAQQSMDPRESPRPKVRGTLSVKTRSRKGGRASENSLQWQASQTAIIICDMWDAHTCGMAAHRVSVMAPRMNEVVTAARSAGVMIIHSPSDTMSFYEGTPARIRMQRAPKAESPFPLLNRCPRDPDEMRDFPIDDSSECDDPVVTEYKGPPWPWKREHPAIQIVGFDGVSESGQEIYNFCKQEGITNIALMGVHTNICILNRSFGARQMTRLGFNVVLVRDLTDAMYDPRRRPFVSHTRGTELVIEHIEARWCPSILSTDLMKVIPGSDNPRT